MTGQAYYNKSSAVLQKMRNLQCHVAKEPIILCFDDWMG